MTLELRKLTNTGPADFSVTSKGEGGGEGGGERALTRYLRHLIAGGKDWKFSANVATPRQRSPRG